MTVETSKKRYALSGSQRLAYYLVFALIRLICLLPWPVMLWLSRLLSRLLRFLGTKRSRIIDINLRLAFPEISPLERERLIRKTHDNVLVSLFEFLRALMFSERRLSPILSYSGLDNLKAAYETGRPVILLNSHMAYMHMSARLESQAVAQHLDIVDSYLPISIYRLIRRPVAEALIKDIRSRHGLMVPSNDIKKALRLLKKHRFCWYMLDQADPYTGVELDFFGQKVWFNPAIRRIAKLTNALVIHCTLSTDDNRSYYRLNIHEPLENFPSENVTADMQRIAGLIEAEIKAAPEFYLWAHRLFKPKDNDLEISPYRHL